MFIVCPNDVSNILNSSDAKKLKKLRKSKSKMTDDICYLDRVIRAIITFNGQKKYAFYSLIK